MLWDLDVTLAMKKTTVVQHCRVPITLKSPSLINPTVRTAWWPVLEIYGTDGLDRFVFGK
jgi:hypothetical protein